ncbi:hypothetical protein FRC20_004050 [Serendipita sp. 405]|nr:hypothetical protein FRC18_010028 [Serendipita sp. 400]KAG8868152.1 hypothetical protein FRC20_004050 [Serendipita sp. 405]
MTNPNSAFFNVPITVKRVYVSPTPEPRHIPTPSNPIVQNRRVHLLTAPLSLRDSDAASWDPARPPQQRVACVATSVVRITSEQAARHFLDERYAIGQVFRILGRVANFQLLEVTVGQGNGAIGNLGKEYLRRKYLLKTEGFECEIQEVFPDREMFSVNNQEWLTTLDDFKDTDFN